MTETLRRIAEIMNPANQGYGVVWAMVCLESSKGAFYGARDFRNLLDTVRLSGVQRMEETAFIAETLRAERGFVCPGFALSETDFQESSSVLDVRPYSDYKHHVLPRSWFKSSVRHATIARVQ